MKKLITALFLLFGLVLQPVAWADNPQDMIKATSTQVLAAIASQRDNFSQNPAELYKLVDELVLPHFDFEHMTDLALGKYRRSTSEADKQELIKAFQELLVRTYSKALLQYQDQKIEYQPMQGDLSKGDVTVRTQIEQQGGFPIPLNYSVSNDKGDWKVYDISVDGVSLVTNYRSSFAREIKNGGVPALIKTLQQRNESDS